MKADTSNNRATGRIRTWPRTLTSVALFALIVVVLLLAAGKDTHSVAAAEPNKRLRVVAVGDLACAPGETVGPTTCRHADVARLVERLRPKHTLFPGDIQYNIGSLAAFQASFGTAFASLRRTWRPSPGNHEYYTTGASGYYDFFGNSAGPDRRGWYSFDAGNWHIVSLNSNCEIVGCGPGSQQLKWLRRDLARSRSKCTIAYWHHPLASSGNHGGHAKVAPLWAELQRKHAELVITGHDHNYERFRPIDANGKPSRRGIREMVVGTGGKSIYPFGEPRPGSVVRREAFGAVALDLMRDRMAWKFVSIDGRVLDRGRANCR